MVNSSFYLKEGVRSSAAPSTNSEPLYILAYPAYLSIRVTSRKSPDQPRIALSLVNSSPLTSSNLCSRSSTVRRFFSSPRISRMILPSIIMISRLPCDDGILHVVGDHQSGQVIPVDDLLRSLQHLRRGLGIQRRSMLVQQQQLAASSDVAIRRVSA